jgi:cytochrome c oxidase subunit IV
MATQHDQAHGHDEHHDDHGISHVASIKNLLTTWIALMILTVVTVGATRFDFGSGANLAIAMAIAVVKATLVCLFFMHLKYDKLFHTVLIVGAVVTAALFVGYTLLDSNQYQNTNIWDVNNPPPAPFGPRPTVE